MRKQLELEGIPRKRVPLVAEAASKVAVADEPGETDWFPDTKEPPSSGYWDVLETFDGEGKIVRHFYDRKSGQWPDFLTQVAAFKWRGLKAPAPGGYPYNLDQARVRRRVITSD